MNVVIVEDEVPAAERLKYLLQAHDPSINVTACLDSISETVGYLSSQPHPDILFLDIHLSDGHSFEIFNRVQYNKPVVFTTAYDRYALDAFKVLCIDYILKPITQDALKTAIGKLKSLSLEILPQYLPGQQAAAKTNYTNQFFTRIGQRHFFVKEEDISFFQADNKVVFIVDKSGHRYIIDQTLEKIQEIADPSLFFRISRRFIVRRSVIGEVKPYLNSRLQIVLNRPPMTLPLIISRDRVPAFRQWLRRGC